MSHYVGKRLVLKLEKVITIHIFKDHRLVSFGYNIDRTFMNSYNFNFLEPYMKNKF